MKQGSIFFLVLLCSQILLGQSSPSVDRDLLLGKKEFIATHPDYILHPQATNAFKKMQAAAKKDSITIKVVSSFRSYAAQKRIWNRKYKRLIKEGYTGPEAISKIIEYSTLPGTSRHHWGTDLDLIDESKKVEGDVLLEEHFHHGPYEKLRMWLEKNALTYGFEIVYTQDSLRKGFLYEPWHYSFTRLSKSFLKAYRENDMINAISKDTTLLGNEFITPEFLAKYAKENIEGINPRLKQ